MLVVAGDGCEISIWRATERLSQARQAVPLASQLAGGAPVAYADFLVWRGLLDKEPPRRPAPRPPAAPAMARRRAWKYALIGCRCEQCGTAHLPPQRVCMTCGAQDQMTSESFADKNGTLATFTLDTLTPSVSGAIAAGFIDFDGGGRMECEIVEADPKRLRVGAQVTMTFRRRYVADGIHNYAWKARLVE